MLSITRATIDHLLQRANRNATGVLSVPAMRGKYVWLTNEEFAAPRRGTVTFEAKANNDICVCFHTENTSTIIGRDGVKEGSAAYEILFGGWSNSKTVIRKNGQKKIVITKAEKENAAIRSANMFLSYWVTIYDDWIYAGVGEIGCNEILRWQDPKPKDKIKTVGFGSWNTPVQYKNICIAAPFIPKIHLFELNGEELLSNPKNGLTDGTITIQNKEFPIHKAILYCWNKSFVNISKQEQETVNNKTKPHSEPLIRPIPANPSRSDEQIVIKPTTDSLHQNEIHSQSSTNLFSSNHLPSSLINWDSLGVLLFRKLLKFFYSGTIQDLSNEELVKLIKFANKYSLKTLVDNLHQLSCADTEEAKQKNIFSNDPENAMKNVICFGELFRNQLFSDVTFIFDGDPGDPPKKLYAHRVILSLWSDPFMAMFTGYKESSMKEIYLPEVSYPEFKLLLEYCYCGMIKIPARRAITLLMLADRFDITPLQELCCEVVVNYIDCDNCCILLELANHCNWTSLRACCIRFIETNFKQVADCKEFVDINPTSLLELLLSDDLMVSDESEVYNSFMNWLNHKFPNNSYGKEFEILVDLFLCIRFPLMGESFILQEIIDKNPLYVLSERVRSKINDVLEYIRFTDNDTMQVQEQNITHTSNKSQTVATNLPTGPQISEFTIRPRTTNKYHQLTFSHCGDKNGVCYFIGCNYGKNQIWCNPHKTKKLTVTFSSPQNRYSRPELLVSRNYTSTNFTTGNPPWCMIDFGEGHELICNHYTMRVDGSKNFVTSWCLQGSNKLDDPWVSLRVHRNDDSFYLPGQHTDWAVFGKSARYPYRYFRIVALSSNILELSSIELYGYFK